MEAPSPAHVRLQLFGTPLIHVGGEVSRLALPAKALVLLLLLAAESGRPQLRSRLAECLWPEVTDEEARANLRRHLHLLTRRLGASAFVLTKNSAQWNGDAVPCDVVEFLRYAGDRRRYERAVALWAGESLSGVHDDALIPLRERLTAEYAKMLRDLAGDARASHRPGEALRYLDRLLAIDPLDESTARALIETRVEAGDRNGALNEYNVLARRLRTELEVEPERETTELFQRVLYGADGSAPRHNLPAQTTSFVGRQRELSAIAAMLSEHRVVTLVGPAGIGKTRLAVRSSLNALGQFTEGILFVDLSTAQNSTEIRSRIAQVLETSGDVVAALRNRGVLLVLDNCEHVLDDVRILIDEFARDTPVRMLVTSRRKIACDGEHTLTIEPLPLPPQRVVQSVREVAVYPAVRLFVERAVNVSPSFRLSEENAHTVTDIVCRLDGLPLAIELVAARAGLLTAEGMLKRLADVAAFAARRVEARHSTLEAALQWSYALLSPLEQQVFTRLFVFSGSFSIEAAQHVCNDLCDDVLPALTELVESSLVQARLTHETPRFALLETVRAFATELARKSGVIDGMQAAHAAHFAAVAEECAREFVTEHELEAYHGCDLDAGNFAAALEWAASADRSLALRLIISLWRYWIFRWSFDGARTILHALLDSPEFESESPDIRARAYQAAGMFEKERADAVMARTFFERSLEQCRAGNLYDVELQVLNAMAILEFNHGDPREAGRLYEACLALQERSGDVRAAAETIANLGAVAQSLNDYARATKLFGHALDAFRATGNPRGVAYALRSLTLCCEMLGQFDEGIAYGQECVAAYEALGERARLADGLQTLANLYSKMGDQREALALSARALEILSHVEHRIFTMLALFGYAMASHYAGNQLAAAHAFAKAWDVRETSHLSLQEENRVLFADTTEAVKASLGERLFAMAWNHGKQLTIAQLASEAEATSTALEARKWVINHLTH